MQENSAITSSQFIKSRFSALQTGNQLIGTHEKDPDADYLIYRCLRKSLAMYQLL